MTAYDFFYLSLGVGFLALVVSLVMIGFQVYRILGDIRVVSRDVSMVRQGVATIIRRFFGTNKKGGETNAEEE